MAALFPVRIVTPEGAAFSESVQGLRLPGVDGLFGVLARHAPMISALVAGVLEITLASGERQSWAIGEGFLEVTAEGATILTDFATPGTKVDVPRAEAALERAQARIKERHPDVDLMRAEAALQRAIARLKASRGP